MGYTITALNNGRYETKDTATIHTSNDKGDKVIMNVSNRRNASRIDGSINNYLNKEDKYYVRNSANSKYELIVPSTNLNNPDYHNKSITKDSMYNQKFYIMMAGDTLYNKE
jgi:hypothetical protein